MSAVKLGYVVVYPNPPMCKGIDQFLRLDTTGPSMKFDTACCSLEQATVFEREETARHFAAHCPANDRSADVREVHQVTYRKLAETGPAKAFADVLKEFAEKRPIVHPQNAYNAKRGFPDGAIPMGQGTDAIAQDALINRAELGLTEEEALKNPPAVTLNGLKGWPRPAEIDYNVTLVPGADQEPADGHAPAVATGTPGSPQFK